MRKAVLMILDGWGVGNGTKSDVISQVPTPFLDSLYNKYPNATLQTGGEQVGLPKGQMGNSEVGHLNIGAGRVIYQDLVRVNQAIEKNILHENSTVQQLIAYVKENGKKLHLIGLVGDGGVHATTDHLVALCEIAKKYDLEQTFIHAITDGRDTDPRSGLQFMKELISRTATTPARIASVIGRYYAMDRDKNWDRVKLAYDLYSEGLGTSSQNPLEAIEQSYNDDITDEFIKPVVIKNQLGEPLATIQDGDAVLCFNFRTDRLRQLTIAFTQENLSQHSMVTIPSLQWYTMTEYNSSFHNVKPIFPKQNLTQTLGEIIASEGLRQLRIAETEKYAHVTFFFSGGREEPFPNEKRILIPSPKVATYDLQPEMSAYEVAQKLTDELNKQSVDFVCLNFANGDMVGHTGVYEAIAEAVQTIDKVVEQVVTASEKNQYDVLIIADHGNADYAVNEDGTPNTAHSLNPVPIIWVTSQKNKQLADGILADVAPTILTMMELPIPTEMTGSSLIQSS